MAKKRKLKNKIEKKKKNSADNMLVLINQRKKSTKTIYKSINLSMMTNNNFKYLRKLTYKIL